MYCKLVNMWPSLGLAKKQTLNLVNFVPALAYHFCQALPAAVTQPGDRLSAEPCRDNDRAY